MKILFVRTIPQYQNPASYNVQSIGLGKAFVDLGHDYDYVCPKNKEERVWTFYENNGHLGRCIEMKRIRFIRWGIFTKILDESFLEQYDMIISQEYYQIMTYLLARKSSKVVMYNGPYYNLFMFPFFSPIYDYFMTKRINDLVKIKYVKSILSKKFLEDKGYTNVVNVGVGLDVSRFDDDIQPFGKTIDIIHFMETYPCILYVGNLMDRKNYPFMVKVYENLLRHKPDLKFVVIGKSKIGAFEKLFGGKDMDYEKRINKMIPEHVRRGIYRVEKIDNNQLKYIYPLAKAFLLPSKKEIFGMVLPEAMYLGAPVVTSSNGGSLTLIGEHGPGRIIKEFDVEKWSDTIIEFLDNPEMTERMKKQAKELIRENFTWKTIACNMLLNQ